MGQLFKKSPPDQIVFISFTSITQNLPVWRTGMVGENPSEAPSGQFELERKVQPPGIQPPNPGGLWTAASSRLKGP